MLDETLEIKKEERTAFEALPSDVYPAELLDIRLEEKPDYNDKTKMKKTFTFIYAMLGGKDKKGESARTRLVFNSFMPTSLYIGKNGKCMTWLAIEALLERELTAEEEAAGLSGKDLNSLVGMQCRVFVENQKSQDGKNYNKITKFLAIDDKRQSLAGDEKTKLIESLLKSKDEETHPQEEQILVEDIPFGDDDIPMSAIPA